MANSVVDILERYANEMTDALQNSLQANGRYASGTSAQSIIAMPITVMGGKYRMEIRMAEYLEYVDKGVSGTLVRYNTPYFFKSYTGMIPVHVMKGHIANRGITPRPLPKTKRKRLKPSKKSPQERAIESAAYAMSIMTKRKGLKPTNFIEEGIGNDESGLIADMNKQLLEALGEEIVVQIVN